MMFFLLYIGVGQFLAGSLSSDVLKEFTKFRERLLAFVLIVIGWPFVLWLICKREE